MMYTVGVVLTIIGAAPSVGLLLIAGWRDAKSRD